MTTIPYIAIHYSGQKIPQTPVDWKFRTLANFVCDIYSQYLDGYMPNKVAKINFDLRLKDPNVLSKPFYFQQICTINGGIDEEKYIKNTDQENLYYLLELLHNALVKTALLDKWDTEKFINCYQKIIDKNFQFIVDLPEKVSKKGIIAKPYIEKNLLRSYLKMQIIKDSVGVDITLIDKKNDWTFDSIYKLSKKLKWFNAYEFGLEIKDLNVKICYSVKDNNIESNLEYDERMMIVNKAATNMG